MQILKQEWWAPFAGLLVLSHLWVAMAFFLDADVADTESTAVGAALALGGAATLAVGLWMRPRHRGLGNALVIGGAAMAGFWFWTVVMPILGIIVIVGVVASQVRSTAQELRAH